MARIVPPPVFHGKQRFYDSARRARNILDAADKKHKNEEYAKRHFLKFLEADTNQYLRESKHLSNGRIAADYVHLHAMLDFISRGELAGKHILHVGASTGVYANFLQDFCGARAVALDLNRSAIQEARARGVRNANHGSAIPIRIRAKPVLLHAGKRQGVWIPRERKTKLKFKDGTFDYIVSDHFLFSDFHKEYLKERGFETAPSLYMDSEEALKEYNRILRKGGRVIIDGAHPTDLPGLGKYRRFFRIHGFIVEKIFDPYLEGLEAQKERIAKHPYKQGPSMFVLKKISTLPSKPSRVIRLPDKKN